VEENGSHWSSIKGCQKKTTYEELTQWSTKLFDHAPVLYDGLHYEDHLRGETRAKVKFHNVY
jgi:hypothetical protein